MEYNKKKGIQKKNKEIGKNQSSTFDGNSQTYEEIAAENEHLRKRVTELMKVVAEMENEKKKLSMEIRELNDDVINSLVAERDEILESKFRYMDDLKECQQKMKELEGERDAEIFEEFQNENHSYCKDEMRGRIFRLDLRIITEIHTNGFYKK